jgi:hypothetical protein
VNWGALGADLITFVKATHKYEIAKRSVVDLSEFPAHILAALRDKKINLTGVAAGESPSLKLAKELGRLRVATHEELDWPYPRVWQGIFCEKGFPNLRRGREVHGQQGYFGLQKGRETAGLLWPEVEKHIARLVTLVLPKEERLSVSTASRV